MYEEMKEEAEREHQELFEKIKTRFRGVIQEKQLLVQVRNLLQFLLF